MEILLDQITKKLIEKFSPMWTNKQIWEFEQINENYSEEESLELERRFINSVKSADPKKFRRGLAKINESKKNDS